MKIRIKNLISLVLGVVLFLSTVFIVRADIALHSGWNLVASPYNIDVSIEQGVSSLEGCYQYVFSYQNNSWKSYNYLKQQNSLFTLARDYGYWIKINCTQANWSTVVFPENCSNGFDDNLNGNIDCSDNDCVTYLTCLKCIDDDSDGYGVCPNCGTSLNCTYNGTDCDDNDASIKPGVLDSPDNMYFDSNCDGIDGELNNSVFVSTTGSDTSSTCSLAAPCKTISRGLQIAVSRGIYYVLLNAGGYNEVVNISSAHNGIGIYGGYGANWARGSSSTPEFRTTILGGLYSGDSEYMCVRARSTRFSFVNLYLQGTSASGENNGYARSSYVVHAINSNLTFEYITFIQANGATGANGQAGVVASPTRAPSGFAGDNNEQYSTSCDDNNGELGGARATNAGCSSGTGGGTGGTGGNMDTSCPFSLTATAGSSGYNADVYGTGYGTGGTGGAGADTCADGTTGIAGRAGNNGGGGSGGSGYNIYSSHWWSARSGGNGSVGTDGSGGGGGGGGGGCDTGTDATGAGGGGGAAGGCRSPQGGSGGKGGGGSFGIFAVAGTINVNQCTFNRGAAGNGGAGGNGASGQLGGFGGARGEGPGAGWGGYGGAGGNGGYSGGAGGGVGGYTYGIYTYNSVVNQANNIFNSGSSGSGGTYGTSGGYSGTSGANGILGTVGTFTP